MIHVTKRNGEKEPFNIEKVHKIINWAIDGLENVSLSDIEMNAKLSITDGISTRDIHQTLIKSASDLTSIEQPNYQYVAARLLNYALRKEVWGDNESPRLYEHILSCVNKNVYDPLILEKYSESEIHKIGKIVKHNRDDLFTYSGLQQLIDKYLIKNRDTKEFYETPQFCYILISMFGFMNYPKETRLTYIKKFYDAISTFKLSLPTPIVAGVRSKIRQFASCTLFDCGDSLDSIFATATAVGQYSAKRAGIGLNMSQIRPINSFIRNNEVIHTGIIPYLKVFESIVKSTQQNGIRGASCNVNIQFWHPEILDVLVLKDNSGTDDNRVRKLDYTIHLSKLFYERLVANQDVTLFSPFECPELYDSFGLEGFDTNYIARENDSSLKFKVKVNARKLAQVLAKQRYDTGRIYVMNIDTCNSHNPFKDKVDMTNLCCEVVFPVTNINHIDDSEGEIGVCILAAVNMLETKLDEVQEVTDLAVRFLDEIIDYQDYPVLAAERFTRSRRSLGVGLTNLAAFFATNKVQYGSPESLLLLDEYAEHLQFHLLKAGVGLAKEKGRCDKFNHTKYADGWLPIDTANQEARLLTSRANSCDWEGLRAEIATSGLRNSTYTAIMPCESTSVIHNATNGIEPIRELVTYKKAKTGTLKQVVPRVKSAKYYVRAADIKSNDIMNGVSAVLQKWVDMSISTNHYYNPSNYENRNIPVSVIIKDIFNAYKLGIKTLYYANTFDGDNHTESETSCISGACSV